MSGNAFGQLEPVSLSVLPDIVLSLESILSLSLSNNYLGSTGKFPVTGDIDLAIDKDYITLSDFKSLLLSSFGQENVIQHGGQPSFSVKYQHTDTKYYQVDFMHGEVNWLKLYYFRDENSAYKGSHRNLAISGIFQTQFLDPTTDYVSRYIWSPVRGMVRINRYYDTSIPDVTISQTTHPTLIKYVLGANINSLEDLYNFIPYYEGDPEATYSAIANNFKNANIVDGFVFPTEIQKYI
ncbi:hypothetical protein MIJ3_00072 [Pseudomonas phage vB_PaeM_MIJ3]|uniref:Structural protein n=1 Tax=Pseudomonas phage vB_PaeM_PA5oct TaxID=2163605 RepID=A0A4Y1LUN8_9CAUD|nr:structural protein [Pseudomonas phage vB_PaeM_PA5oct]WPK38704.1 hypothetical protein Cassandra_0028 [Pseudomonas phage Cassandra]WPK39225.1 hypothetical protein Deiofobo_0028 [Pseudomonas phage Deifobo]WPK40258.1 hypothetical protein Paride_0028 [Pseudomonas phage Paride]VOH53898.1 hypothetical protein MIJ3_00072 [Pseudomonas phage vB_PaeM_MIJ3]BDR25816.1 hypothetical protein RVBP16_2560 [Pseudomonas phage sp. 30-2]